MITFETERLILRSWRECDANDLYEICLDPELRQNGVNAYGCVNESLETIRHWMKQNEMLAILHKVDNLIIGLIGLGDMNRYDGYKELEYAISSDYRNNGYATEALERMLDYAFGELQILVIAAWVRSHNIKCARVLEKCGFIYEGTLRKHARDKGNTLCYSILGEDWEKFHKKKIIFGASIGSECRPSELFPNVL